ncbi:peptide/nickel transport system substrate-binding protein [Actinomadura pelletieri DSM 43383]|uniref:Peptide/nickel transport system substrate-binding protein n=1 Tax=Actinomadura pelletieri DSM 43383 TaxID=1120940 RepID=A0A495QXV7_9ACTN|nr:ABC transporter substrate-binding protein [Actinomadura pelletieri]RKS78963.1 peptide/nickel transport system substrate-binding protein [Actinomadura pelletieri DSM 43383]
MLAPVVTSALVISLAAACSSGSSEKKGASSGGTLRVGVVASTISTLDAYANLRSQDFYVRNATMFEPLAHRKKDGGFEWALATGITHNADNTEWTVKLRPNVKFHDGSTFGADDVIAVFQRVLDKKNALIERNYIDFMDPKGIEKVDDLTVKFKLAEPYGPFEFAVTNSNIIFYKKGSKPEQAMGTGPFQLVSFTPGRETVVKRYDGYWGEKAKVDQVKIISFKTAEASTNALIGRQIDASSNILQTSLRTIEKTPGLKIMKSDVNLKVSIGMRADTEPFKDVRVRQAMRLIMNRKLALSNAFDGLGELANDHSGFNRCLPAVPQREQNLEQAKKLLADAGKSNLSINLETAANKPGMLQLVQILAEEAKKIGVTIKVQKMELGAYLEKWGERVFYTGYDTRPYLEGVPEIISNDAVLNHTHWNDAEFKSLAKKLYATSDPNEQCEIEKQMKKIEYDRGASILTATNPTVSVYSSKVNGLIPEFPSGNLYDFRKVTIDQ